MQLTDLFLRAADAHPDRVAVDVPPGSGRALRRTTSYRELRAMAELVRTAVAAHVHEERLVVVHVARDSAWLYAAQLGAMLAGAGYVCVDPSFPDAHLEHVVRDTAAACVLSDPSGTARFGRFGVPVVELHPEHAPPPPAPAAARPSWADERSLAYAVYTSGTTGRPKGVLVEHRGAINLITSGLERFAMTPDDRVAQNSSPAYDSSVEETWLALAAGATVVVLDDEAVRLGPDLVAWLRRERITVLCPPPTLLRTMDCPAPRTSLPALRLCYVGGEPLPADLAQTWGAALHLENGYGPTECTVTVVRCRVHPGEPVAIGKPVPPHLALVVDEHLQPVEPGHEGELCIAGPGLARGYLNRPELTAERFPELPGVGRVYRTGDVVVADPDGTLRYRGRRDGQVKLRGYRIELEAIEAVLAGCPGVREAACAVVGEEPARALAAWCVPRDPDAPPPHDELAHALRRELPDYMVPAHIGLLDRLPRTIGGKVDRRALPQPTVVAQTAPASPTDDPTARIAAAFAQALDLGERPVAPDEDFFELGGNSLRAAVLVSRLRRDEELRVLAVRDVYRAPTPEGLAALAAQHCHDGPRATAHPGTAAGTEASSWLAFTAAQVALLATGFAVATVLLWLLAASLLPWLLTTLSLPMLLLALPWLTAVATALWAALAVLLTVACKRVCIGRYHEGHVGAWSGMRLRHWLVVRVSRLVPWSLLEGTELQSTVLRLLGARVGRRVHLHRGALPAGGWDLLELGDDVALGRDVDLAPCELRDGRLVCGRITIGAGATFEARSGAGPDVTVGEGVCVRPLAYLRPGSRVPANTTVDGVPAEPLGPAPPPPTIDGSKGWSAGRYSGVVVAMRLLLPPLYAMPLALLLVLAFGFADVDADSVRRFLCEQGPTASPGGFALLVLGVVLLLPVRLTATALLLRLLPGVPAATHSLWSLRQWWASTRMRWLEAAGQWLSGTLFWPAWLRLAGMRIGRDTEVSSIHDTLPERTQLGGGSFLADGVYLGVPTRRHGAFVVRDTALGERTFVGNHVVVEAGQRLPDDLLLGIATRVDDANTRPGTAWFGLPAFRLPRREVRTVDRRLTHEPGALRYANRVFWETLRVLLPALPAALTLLWFDAIATFGLAGAAVAGLANAATLMVAVLAAKWLLLGRVRPGQHGLWSCWASRWDFHYVMWQRHARPLLTAFEGTLLLPVYLRLMGMRIGRRCVLGDGFAQVVDPDMITIEDGATVHALFQAHSFEDRVLKIDRVRLGAHSTIGHGAVVLYGADIGERAEVLAHSVVMKHEMLPPGRRYAGAPVTEQA